MPIHEEAIEAKAQENGMLEAIAPPSEQRSSPPAVQPRHAMQRRIIIWTLALVMVPTLLCALWLGAAARRTMSDHHARNAGMFSQTISSAIVGHLDEGWSPAADHLLDTVLLDQRVAFVLVNDAKGELLHRRAPDSDAWAQFTHVTGVKGMNGDIVIDGPLFLGRENEIVICRMPIWNPPLRTDAPRRLEGFLLLGLRDKSMPAMMEQLGAAQLLAAGALCVISLPMVLIGARRWTAPLRALLLGTHHLGFGEDPPPVPVTTRDEIGLLGESFNLMARKLTTAHRQLRVANEDLDRKVQARTRELVRVNERLEAEIREKNDFLRGVSHDLGAPLRNIDGMAALLLAKHRQQLSDDALSKLERISANVKLEIDLLNDLLELSRIRTKPGKREQVDLSAVVAELRGSLSYDLEASRIELDILDPLPTIVAERNRMRQVFQNLLDNAVKYMLDATQRRITIRCRQDDDQWRFTVADTGRGIAAEDQPHIFDVFRRATRSGTHHVAGKGVGLAGVKAIVESYGGRIWVESELGQGSAFHFTLRGQAAALPVETVAP